MSDIEQLLSAHNIKIPSYSSGRYYTTCPWCSHLRKNAHQKLKCLGVTVKADKVYWGCNNCLITGPERGARDDLPHYDYGDNRKSRINGRYVWEHRNGAGTWETGTDQTDKPTLYRIDEALESGQTILIVEGEKDVDTLWKHGFAATCGPHGANTWTAAHSELLRGRDIVVLNDNDEPGYKYAAKVVECSLGVALSVRRLDLKDYWPGISDGNDITDWFDNEGSAQALGDILAELGEIQPSAKVHSTSTPPPGAGPPPPPDPAAYVWQPPESLKPRPWLLGTMLMRGYATVLGSTGGVGKTSISIMSALALATGRRELTDQHVFIRCNCWYITLEDDRIEMNRRIGAAMLHHGIDAAEVENRIFIDDKKSFPIVLGEQDKKGNFVINKQDADRLCDTIDAKNILLTVIDPLIKSHRITENSNEHMDRLISLCNDIAAATNSSILIPAHSRKAGLNGSDNGSKDSIRGGGALIDGARIARTLTAMDDQDAALFSIPNEEAWRYFAIGDAKTNLAPRGQRSWVKMISVPLGNTNMDSDYPAGDNVQVAQPWQSPDAFAGLHSGSFGPIFDAIDAGPGAGWFYGYDKRSKYWAGTLLIDQLSRTEEQAKAMLAVWLKSGVLKKQPYLTPTKNPADRLVCDRDKIDEMSGGGKTTT
jgi:hypothetical protein